MLTLPKFEDNNNEKRKSNYLLEGLEMFQNKLSPLTRSEYEKIRDDFLLGADVTLILMEKSLYHIIDSVSTVYSQYNISEVIPFEDGLNYAIYKFNTKLHQMKFLPYYLSEYRQNTIGLYVYRYLVREYQSKVKKQNQSVEILNSKEIIKLVDEKYEYDPNKKIIFNDTLKELIARLNKEEQEILCLKLGLFNVPEMSYRAIAEKFNYKEAKVRNIFANALHKLKSIKQSKELAYYYDLASDLIN